MSRLCTAAVDKLFTMTTDGDELVSQVVTGEGCYAVIYDDSTIDAAVRVVGTWAANKDLPDFTRQDADVMRATIEARCN